MAAPSGTTWGSIAGSYGRIGIYVGLSNTNTQTTVTISTWFWSKYSVTDSNNNYYYNNNATSATNLIGSISIKTTVDTGSGWSTSNQVKLGETTYTYTRGTTAVTRNCAIKLTDIDRVGATMTHKRSYTIPALASYTIKYNANGGSGAPSSQTKYYGKSLTISSTKPTRTGYTFVGWALTKADADAGTWYYKAGSTCGKNENLTLYAVWEAITYTIKYNANGGSGAPSSQTKTYGETLTLSSVIPTRTSVEDNGILTEYTFKGWATSANSTSVAYKAGANYTANASVTLYAVWSRTVSVNLYDVSYNTNGGSEVISQIKIKGKTLVLRNVIPVRNGYTFAGWGLSADSTTVSYESGGNYTLDEDIVLYAIWIPWSHTVTFDSNGGIGSTPENFTKTTGADDIIIPDCSLTKKGHVFKYWSTQPSGSGGKKYYVGDGYNGVKNGGTVTLYAIWDTTNIFFYKNGNCKAGEFIEGDYCGLNNDGTVHFVNFIEGNSSIKIDPTAIYVSELLERTVAYLTDELDSYLVDESGNYLTTIV